MYIWSYLRETTEWMLQAASKEKVVVDEESQQDYERRRKEEQVKNWEEKALHDELVLEMVKEWILAAHEQALRTNSIM